MATVNAKTLVSEAGDLTRFDSPAKERIGQSAAHSTIPADSHNSEKDRISTRDRAEGKIEVFKTKKTGRTKYFERNFRPILRPDKVDITLDFIE